MITNELYNYLLSLRPENVNKDLIYDLFSKKVDTGLNGEKITILPPKLYPFEKITVPKGTLSNLTETVETTVGIYFFNMFFIDGCFGNKIAYINKTLKDKDLKGINNTIINLLLEDKVESKQFGLFQERLVWFNNFTEIFIAGVTMNLLTPTKKIMDLKKKLIEENKEIIENNDIIGYVNNVEKPLLKAAEEELKNDPGWALFELGSKPSFGNNYKNMVLGVGSIFNIATGKYEISTNSFGEGIPIDKQYLYANSAIYGSYNRGVMTQYGGAKTKELFAALQSIYLDDPGYDCGTKLLKSVELTDDNIGAYMWRYISENGKLILITPENQNEYIGKKVAMRTPLFCQSDNICSYCAGELFNKIGLKNIGPATTKITSTFLNLSLKSMHDQSVKTSTFNPFDYIKKIS